MNKKIFRAPNIQEALASIKEELGPDAMILSTRKIPKPPRDPYAREMFEVEAGLKAEEPEKKSLAGMWNWTNCGPIFPKSRT